MNFDAISDNILKRFGKTITTIDSHTAGEKTRLIVDGMGDIPGETMMDKCNFLKEKRDNIRKLMTWPPRGDKSVLAALVTEPVSDGADFGLIYMDAKRYPYLCGHATIGAVMTLIETGVLEKQGNSPKVLVDTPSGIMETRAHLYNGQVESVSIKMPPSFVYETGKKLKSSQHGEIHVDLVCVGGFFVMADVGSTGLAFITENEKSLISLGMELIDLANDAFTVMHPERPEVKTVDVTEFYDGLHTDKGNSRVIYGEAHMDRSPCGTGTAAKLTLLHHKGLIGVDQIFQNSGPLGTTFSAKVVKETRIGELNGVETEITGSASITGYHEFVLDEKDPFQEGYPP